MSLEVVLNPALPRRRASQRASRASCAACDSSILFVVPLSSDEGDSIDIKYPSNRNSGLISKIQDPRSALWDTLEKCFLTRVAKADDALPDA